jgi:hypothetical protein
LTRRLRRCVIIDSNLSNGHVSNEHTNGTFMSTDYRPFSSIYINDLIDGRLENVRIHKREDGALSLTDGWNFLWVYFNAEGLVKSFSRYAPNGDPRGILREISETLDLEIVSEHEPQFWGFETWEELNAAI